jgi:hypothetical protein
MISKLPNADMYNSFAYHVSLLKDFVRGDVNGGTHSTRSFRGGRRGGSLRGGSFRGSILSRTVHNKPIKDSSVHSVGSLRGNGSFGRNNNMSRSVSVAAFSSGR